MLWQHSCAHASYDHKTSARLGCTAMSGKDECVVLRNHCLEASAIQVVLRRLLRVCESMYRCA